MIDLNGMSIDVASYQPALLALSLLCLMVLLQNLLTAPFAFLKQQQSPGMPLKGDHSLFSFRVLRTHANSVESLGPFGLIVIVAVLVGIHASLINWLASLHVILRLGFWLVYYSGKGKVAGGPRTICFVGGLLANFIIVIAVFLKLI